MTDRNLTSPFDEQSGRAGMTHGGHGGHGHGAHHWMMIACCIPMIVIALVLVATGVVNVGFLLVALGCLAMMWFMMRAMGGMDRQGQ